MRWKTGTSGSEGAGAQQCAPRYPAKGAVDPGGSVVGGKAVDRSFAFVGGGKYRWSQISEVSDYSVHSPVVVVPLLGRYRPLPDLSGQAQAYIEAVNRGDWDAAVQFLSPEVLLVDYSFGGTQRGREAWVARFKPFTEAFPDTRLELASAITEGRRMAQEVVIRGTHTAPLSLPTGETSQRRGVRSCPANEIAPTVTRWPVRHLEARLVSGDASAPTGGFGDDMRAENAGEQLDPGFSALVERFGAERGVVGGVVLASVGGGYLFRRDRWGRGGRRRGVARRGGQGQPEPAGEPRPPGPPFASVQADARVHAGSHVAAQRRRAQGGGPTPPLPPPLRLDQPVLGEQG